MRSLQSPALCVAVLGVGLSLAGCSSAPSYRNAEVVKAIEGIATTEYHLDVSVRRTGETIAVHLRHPGILMREGGQIRLAPSANEVLGNIIEAIHRVTLSAETRPGFYFLVVSDPAMPGTCLTLVRYLEDVLRVNANSITPTEFFQRTVLELQQLNPPVLDFTHLVIQDITLEQFLSWQLAHRIHDRLTTHAQREGLSNLTIGPCIGEFRTNEFVFTLNVAPPPGAPLDEPLIQSFFHDATTVVASVLSDYRFDRFETVRLIHQPTGRNILLPKAQLQIFR